MTSTALKDLEVALADVEFVINHAQSYANGARGAPRGVGSTARPARPFTQAAIVTIAGAVEAYVETLALETMGKLSLTAEQNAHIKEYASRLHGIGVRKIDELYALLGVPFVVDRLSWKNSTAGKARAKLEKLRRARNKIAHGAAPSSSRVKEASNYVTFARNFAAALERTVERELKIKF